MSETSINFDSLELAKIPVRLAGKEYILKEASESAALAYRNACVKAAKMTDGKVTSMDGVGSIQPLLVSKCLYDPQGDLVPMDTILGWPSKVIKVLFEWIQKTSGLGEDVKEKEGPELKN